MSLVTPRTPAGTMELLPREQIAFQRMLDIIRKGYERFGFLPVETPVFEQRDVLLTKSGGETEKQVYFVQSTGSIEQGHAPDMALRFDLTVPLARYVAEHERDLVFPFRRYQIQRVYRGERAQKGRFREFYQCDIDVIGKDKLDPAYDAEIPAIIAQIFTELNVGDFTINFSNRKILLGLFAALGYDDDKQKLCLREIDKLDKIGVAKVRENLGALGMKAEDAEKVLRLIGGATNNAAIIALLKAETIDHPVFKAGVEEAESTVAALAALGVPEGRARLNLAIARGLDYYTGTVYETVIDAHPEFGSVCSGGRYDDLASLYTKSKLPGVGISIGATRLFDLLRSIGWAKDAASTVQILILQLDPALRHDYLALAAKLREAGLNTEVYLEPAKLDKQMRYADRAGIPLAVLMGEDERAKRVVQLKNLQTKEQREVAIGDIAARAKEILNAAP
ncbi:MAG: histidine--tRNA ligase [Alphaproteobacteria bacterium]